MHSRYLFYPLSIFQRVVATAFHIFLLLHKSFLLVIVKLNLSSQQVHVILLKTKHDLAVGSASAFISTAAVFRNSSGGKGKLQMDIIFILLDSMVGM